MFVEKPHDVAKVVYVSIGEKQVASAPAACIGGSESNRAEDHLRAAVSSSSFGPSQPSAVSNRLSARSISAHAA